MLGLKRLREAKPWQTILPRWFWAGIFCYASMIEWEHMRSGMEERDFLETAGPTVAAIACGFMASEAIEGNWP